MASRFKTQVLAAYRSILGRWQDLRSNRRLRCVQNRLRESDGCVLFCSIRDEMQRLPFFHDYYRALGVDHFIFIDNGSNDGFRTWCADKNDVSLWSAGKKQADSGLRSRNALLRKYGTGRLCVNVEPDEFLVYPHIETRSLKDLGQYLKETGRPVLGAVTIDAYGRQPAAGTVLATGDDPFRLCRYFDRDGYVQSRAGHSRTLIQGGPRLRVFNRRTPKKAPALDRIPVVWWQGHYRYLSPHDLWPPSLNRPATRAGIPLSACLFRFAFVASPGRGKRQSGEILHRDGISVAYENPAQLVALGLMNEGEWM